MSLPVIQNVIVRSEVSNGREQAWAALRLTQGRRVKSIVLSDFKAEEFGREAFSQAAKYARRLAEQLEVPYVKKRAPEMDNVSPLSQRKRG